MRPEWSWVAEDEGRLLARALWWGRAEEAPSALDALDVLPGAGAPGAVAAELLAWGHEAFTRAGLKQQPSFTLRLPGGWRTDPAAFAAASWRIAAAAEAGLTESLERLQFAWTPESGVPGSSGRVDFRAGDDEEFVELFRQAAQGSLDEETRRDLETMDVVSQARGDLEFYASAPGERSWWRVAVMGDERVGFVVPSATPYHRSVGYLGVLPDHRGSGLVDDLLAEITCMHAEAGAERVTATTDLANRPMAAAFERAGYCVTEVRMMLEAPRPGL